MSDSQAIQTLDASGGDNIPNARLSSAVLQEAIGVITFDSATPADDSVHRIARLQRNARVVSILATCPDMGTTLNANIGLHRTPGNGGASVDEDAFATASAFAGGSLTDSERIEEGVWSSQDREQTIAERLGTNDVGDAEYDIALKLSAAGVGVPTDEGISFRILYVQ